MRAGIHTSNGYYTSNGYDQMIRQAASAAGALLVAGSVLAACGSSGTTTSTGTAASGAATSQCAPPGGSVSSTALTASYKEVAYIGSVQPMYSKGQVAGHQLTKAQMANGEVMVSGSMTPYPGSGGMSGMSGMSGSSPGTVSGTAADYQHLEIHVCSRTTGKVVTTMHPTITVVDTTANNRSTVVPVAVMQGVELGTSDLHYGNNVLMPAGHHFTITMVGGGETATFHLTRPAS